jgi:hypothetical protein
MRKQPSGRPSASIAAKACFYQPDPILAHGLKANFLRPSGLMVVAIELCLRLPAAVDADRLVRHKTGGVRGNNATTAATPVAAVMMLTSRFPT